MKTPPSPCGCHKWYYDIWQQAWATQSHMRSEQSSIRSSWGKLHLWNKSKAHLPGTWKETYYVSVKTPFWDKWNSSNTSGVFLLFLSNVHQGLMKLQNINFLQFDSQNTQLSAMGCRTPLSSKTTVPTFNPNMLLQYCSVAVWNAL